MVSKRAAGFTTVAGALLVAMSPAAGQSPIPDYVPDYTFQGSQLAGWQPLGQAQWRAENGEISGRAGDTGGWLLLDRTLQDVAVFTRFRCDAPCTTGLLLRAQETPGGGMTGYFVSVADDDYGPYRVTLDGQGRITSRERLRPGPTQIRIAPEPNPNQSSPAQGNMGGAAAASAGGAPGNAGGPIPPAGVSLPGLQPPAADIRRGEWNDLSIILDANVLRPNLHWGNQIGVGATDDESNSYGPIALYVGPGSSEVRFRDVSYRDLNLQQVPAERVSPRFRMQRIDDFSYAWDAAVADINRDGVQDVVAGPYYYLGPDYTNRREIYLAQTFSPSTQYVRNMVTFASDWTGDGWPDVMATEGRQMVLYVNPQGENRRWDRHLVLPGVTTELTLLTDVDGDEVPEIAYAAGGRLVFAKPDPADPHAPWIVHPVSETGLTYFHGLGVGDVNGDGRADMLQPAGWWEQPAAGATSGLWTYHPYEFARWSRSEGSGGGQMSVWDVNGDGLNDVVTSLNAHGWGLAWFEQQRDASGAISFERHMIMDDYTAANPGGLTFSELHAGVIPADVDGDGVMDFVTGKRHWAHRESYTDPDPNGPAVLAWFRGVRNPSAPGGAEFVPELIHNRSGVGSLFKVEDVNRDGAVDIVTSANRGTFIFWGTPR